ncbi:hypothetical protein D3C73_939590 [compost metagenome]
MATDGNGAGLFAASKFSTRCVKCLIKKEASSGFVVLVPSNFSSKLQPAVSIKLMGASFAKSN